MRSYAVTLTGKKCELGEQRVFKGHEGTVTDVASAYGARLFASCSVDGTARVWKIDGGESANEKVTKKRRTSKKSEATDDDAMDRRRARENWSRRGARVARAHGPSASGFLGKPASTLDRRIR